MKNNSFSLRERKFADTKISIIHLFLEELKEKRLEEICIKGLCEKCNISEGTFYNYFPQKIDLLLYSIKLWIIEASILAEDEYKKTNSNLKAIEKIFDFSAQGIMENKRAMFEIIALSARYGGGVELGDLSKAEFYKLFSEDSADSENIKDFNSVLMPFVERAVNSNELPESAPVKDIIVVLKSIFFGTPIALGKENIHKIRKAYQDHLKGVWHSLNN